jgi:uncharacterized membrane protein
MAQFVGYALIGLFFIGLVWLLAARLSIPESLAIIGIAVVASIAIVYGVGLAVTGDWQCWRDLIP